MTASLPASGEGDLEHDLPSLGVQVHLLMPWSENLAKLQVKAPKVPDQGNPSATVAEGEFRDSDSEILAPGSRLRPGVLDSRKAMSRAVVSSPGASHEALARRERTFRSGGAS